MGPEGSFDVSVERLATFTPGRAESRASLRDNPATLSAIAPYIPDNLSFRSREAGELLCLIERFLLDESAFFIRGSFCSATLLTTRQSIVSRLAPIELLGKNSRSIHLFLIPHSCLSSIIGHIAGNKFDSCAVSVTVEQLMERCISIADQTGKTVTTDGTNCFAH